MRNYMISELSQNSNGGKISLDDLHTALKHSDKELFEDFREGKLTVQQYKCKVLRRAFGIKYKVFDDIKEEISPEFTTEEALRKFRPTLNMIYGKNFSEKEVTEPLQPFEINKQCLKSLAQSKQKPKKKVKPDYFFRNTARSDRQNDKNEGNIDKSINLKSSLEKTKEKKSQIDSQMPVQKPYTQKLSVEDVRKINEKKNDILL